MNHSPTRNESSIEEAIRRTLAGDVSAFEEVVRQFERPLRVWLATQAPPAIDIDDVAQRTLIAAFSQLGMYGDLKYLDRPSRAFTAQVRPSPPPGEPPY